MTTASDAPDSAEITAHDDLAIRKMLGPYELKRKLGQGGMGAVYLAIEPTKKEQLALKILPREKASNPQLVKRFKAEAQNAAQLTHDNIVRVFGTGEADGYLYIALEFIDGIDVHDLIQKRGVLPVKRSIDIIKQVSRALQHALEQHIVHRDIKPANLLIRRDGVVKLADMGLARAVDETIETGITRAGTTVGTVDYMAPEQARNSKAADVRSDIYSLGCTWYHMLTGRPPFADGSLTNKLHAHAKAPPPDPRTVNANVPEGVVAVMHRMMAKEPADRYQTPQELIKDLEGTLINKDAVSRKILEGIVEDFPQSEPSSSETTFSVADSGSQVRVVPVDSTTEDEYSIRPESSESDVPGSPPEDVPVTPRQPKQATPTTPSKASGAALKGAAPTNSGARQLTEDVEDSHATLIPSKSLKLSPTAKPTTDTSTGSKTNETATRQATTPGKNPTRSQKTEPVGTAHSSGHSLPPPKRRAGGVEISSPSISLPPKKLAAIVGGIAGALLLLVLLFPIIKKSLMGEEPLVVGTNPFDGAAPPPPPPMVAPIPALIPVPAEGANAPGAQQTVKDALTDRKDQLASAGSVGTGGRSGTGANSAASPTGLDARNAAAVEWMDQPLQTTTAPVFSVRQGQQVDSERQYPFLQDALKNVSKDGGRLVLFHEGPFELAPTELTGGIVSIEAASGVRPRIRLVKDRDNNKPPGIVVTGGSLVLDGVDIICDADSAPADLAWTWFQVTGGHIYVKRSSLTLIGQRKGSTTAFKLGGKAPPPFASSRCLFDESVIRGDGLLALQLEAPGLDTVIRDSLVISGESPAVVLRPSQKAPLESTRKLRIGGSTISSRQQSLVLDSTDAATPIATEILLVGSLFAAPENANQSVFLRLDGWPSTKPRLGTAGPFKNLTWVTDGTAALGFHTLVSSGADSSMTVTDGDAWKQLWKESPGMVFSSISWPTNLKGPLAQTDLKSWSMKTLEALPIVFSSSDRIPGCRISNLRAPALSTADQSVVEQGQRPRLPVPFASKLNQPVDLNKTDLGKLIGSKTWDDGTVFQATGSGPRISSPIVIEGRKIRIQFIQADGPPLIVIPKAGPRSGENAAFITVRGGQLDLEQGTFAYDSKDGPSVTPWFMNVEGGGFSLQNCRVTATVATAGRSKGLIRWTPPQGLPNPKSNGEFAAFGQVLNSRLVGNGTLVAMQMSNMAFIAKNSALISRQNVFELAGQVSSPAAASAFDAQECTYLASGTHFVIQSPTGDASKIAPLRLFHQDCVFSTLQAEAGKSSPLLMNVIGAAMPPGMVWNEDGCGYGADLKAFYLASPTVSIAAVPPQDFAQEWVKRWGETRIQRPLRTDTAIVFEKNLAGASPVVKVENLTLHKSSPARTWSETGGLIGVRPEALEPAPPPAPAVRTNPGARKPGPNPTQPGLKL